MSLPKVTCDWQVGVAQARRSGRLRVTTRIGAGNGDPRILHGSKNFNGDHFLRISNGSISLHFLELRPWTVWNQLSIKSNTYAGTALMHSTAFVHSCGHGSPESCKHHLLHKWDGLDLRFSCLTLWAIGNCHLSSGKPHLYFRLRTLRFSGCRMLMNVVHMSARLRSDKK